jgi:proline iminopeptidase
MLVRMGSFYTLVLFALLAGGCANKHVEEGYVDVIGGKIWYRVVGNGPGTPLIVVHGGPGVPHQYLKSLEELSDQRPVIFYDQLGCGKSDHPSGKQLWIPRRFAREINALRDQLNLREVYILSDSWGAVVASEYLLSTPSGVRGVIFSSPVFSGERYVADAERMLDQLPRETRNVIRKREHDGTTGSPEYRRAYKEFYEHFICRNWSVPDEMKDALAHVGPEVYRTMHGTNQVDINGTLRDYDRTGEFWQITQPVLITCGRYDVVTPETAAYFQGRLSKAKLAVFQDSSHTPIYEEHEMFVNSLRAFMRDHDAR